MSSYLSLRKLRILIYDKPPIGIVTYVHSILGYCFFEGLNNCGFPGLERKEP